MIVLRQKIARVTVGTLASFHQVKPPDLGHETGSKGPGIRSGNTRLTPGKLRLGLQSGYGGKHSQ